MRRTFKVQSPPLRGAEDWQRWLNAKMKDWDVDYRLKVDGIYGSVTRDLTASVAYGMGFDPPHVMRDGLSPEFRARLRSGKRNAAQWAKHATRAGWRNRFRARHARKDVASPLGVILSSSWGYHPPVHDGVDLICKPNAPLLAICKATVIRADSGGWWGKGAPSPAVAAKGDGIIVLRSLTDAGPFFKGLNFGYGHAEHPQVRVGQIVEAGDVIGRAGFANAWHIHLVANARHDDRGIGDRDPMRYVNYARKES